MSTPDPQPERILRSPEWRDDAERVAGEEMRGLARYYMVAVSDCDCEAETYTEPEIDPYDGRWVEAEDVPNALVAAYCRGRREERERCAVLLDEYAEAIADLPRDSEVARECAVMLRSEADTPGETAHE